MQDNRNVVCICGYVGCSASRGVLVLFEHHIKMHRNGFMHIVKSSMLSGHPCLMPLRISNGYDRCPLTCTEEVALVYMFLNRVTKVGLNLQCSSTLKRYVCAILSKASVKSRVRRHVGEFLISTWAIVSLIAATAPTLLLSAIPQC